MSYDLKLSKTCDNKVVWDDHITENDLKTVILGLPITSTNIIVRVNDFKIQKDFQSEVLLKEDVSGQVTGTNKMFIVTNGPIYDGLKLKHLSTRFEDVIVRIKVLDEDVSEQFSGTEDYFYTQGRPLMRFNEFDFNCFVQTSDVEVKINNSLLTTEDISKIDSSTGKITLFSPPLSTDVVTVTYYYKAKVVELNALQSRVVIKELPKIDQEVFIAYYSRQNAGWHIETSERALIEKSQDIVFYKELNTDRFFIQLEDVSEQFTGTEMSFQTGNFPLLPLFQNFRTSPDETLNNAVLVYVNDVRVPVAKISSSDGKITLHQIPSNTDVIKVSYYYQAEYEPDRISIDYYVDSIYCDKCSKYSDLLDYSIDKLGHYEKVIEENKLMQDLKKIIRTILGSDPVATWYGTEFESIIGTKMFPEITKTKIIDQIVTALSKLKSIQIQQEEYQTVTGNEFLDTVSKIFVNESITIPTLFTADVSVVTQAGKQISTFESIQTKG